MPLSEPNQFHREFVKAFNAKDVQAILDLYEPDATLFPEPGKAVKGHAEIRAALVEFIKLGGTMEIQTRYVIVSGNIALSCGRWNLKGTGPDGKPMLMESGNVEVLRRQADGSWRVAIDNPYGAE